MNYQLKMSLTKLNQVATRIHFPLEFSIPKVSLFFSFSVWVSTLSIACKYGPWWQPNCIALKVWEVLPDSYSEWREFRIKLMMKLYLKN